MSKELPMLPQTPHEAMAKDRDLSGLTMNRMAAEFDKSKTWAYDVFHGEMSFSLHLFERWARLTGGARHTMRWLGRVTHHWVAPIPAVNELPEQELPALLREFGDVVQGVTEGLADGHITPEEAERVWAEGEELIAATYAVMESFRQRSRRPQLSRTMAEAERKSS